MCLVTCLTFLGQEMRLLQDSARLIWEYPRCICQDLHFRNLLDDFPILDLEDVIVYLGQRHLVNPLNKLLLGLGLLLLHLLCFILRNLLDDFHVFSD